MGVGVDARPARETLPLHRARPVHPLPHRLARLAPALVRQRAVLHGRHLQMDVDAVEQGTRHTGEVALDAERSADAVVLRIAEVAAGTGIHRRGEHEARRIAQAHRGARDRHDAVLHRLAQHLEHVLAELGKLVQEQHAAVREAHLARPRIGAAADQAGVRDGVMRCPEGAPGDERLAQGQDARDRVDLRRFERLVETHLGQDRGEAAGEHRLPGSGRPNHQQIVPARRGDLERPLRVRLPLHVAEIDVVPCALREQRAQVHVRLGQLAPGVEEVRDLRQCPRPEHADPGDHARLSDVLPGEHQRVQPGRAGRQRHG